MDIFGSNDGGKQEVSHRLDDTDGSKVFKLPQCPQTNSRLVCLPAEIRLKILHSLLKHEGPLRSSRNLGIERQRQAFGLTAQILPACQQIYNEASAVLYSVNVLWIDFRIHQGTRTSPNSDTAQLDILNLSVRVPVPVRTTGLRAGDGRVNLALRSSGHYAATIPAAVDNRERLVAIYPGLKNFRRFRVSVDCGRREDSPWARDCACVASYLVRNLLYGKDVVVELKKPEGPAVQGWAWRLEERDPVIAKLSRAWGYPRCEPVAFDGITIVNNPIFDELIKGNKIALDLFTIWADDKTELLQQMRQYETTRGDAAYCRGILHQLRELVKAGDTYGFDNTSRSVPEAMAKSRIEHGEACIEDFVRETGRGADAVADWVWKAAEAMKFVLDAQTQSEILPNIGAVHRECRRTLRQPCPWCSWMPHPMIESATDDETAYSVHDRLVDRLAEFTMQEPSFLTDADDDFDLLDEGFDPFDVVVMQAQLRRPDIASRAESSFASRLGPPPRHRRRHN
ncbi:hypothetical protein OHC33_004385 [Knufia fluminis]|uniref:Uncharacterized protein n=1 Tax=Knufia fluminis TaxID=191047 RepID=A0AAN8EVG7_9EURO|nr:hypothetical protein OHC33_004385 [Knufia fluminis]